MAARATKEISIPRADGSVGIYTLMKCDAKVGMKAALRLGKIIAPTMAAGMAAVESKDGDVEFFKAMASALDRISEDDLDFFTELMAKHTMVGGQMLSTTYGEHFIDRYQEMLIWLYRALEFNFASFFGAAGSTGLLDALLAKAQLAAASLTSLSPTESTGSSTAS